MRKDVENQIYMIGGEILNKSEVARRFGCSWKTVDRKINKSKKYSVPLYLIGKNVTVKESDSGIYIYYSTNFVCSYNTYE